MENIQVYQLAFNYRGVGYELALDLPGQALNIAIDGVTHSIKYKEFDWLTYDYIYKINKYFVSTRNVIELFNHFKDCVDNNFAMDCWCVEPLTRMFNKGK